MRVGTITKTVLAGALALAWVASASAQQVRFPDFSTGTSNLQMKGSAHVATFHSAKVLRLTDGYPGVGATHPETSSAWFELPPSADVNLGRQSVNTGFTTYFKFRIDTAAICCTPADGFAFVIQNSSAAALGTGSGGLGYAGIPNSLAIEFDTYQNPWDPNANHVAVQSCGTAANAATHNTGNCLVGAGIAGIPGTPTIPHLGVTCTSGPCKDGATHEVVVEYAPPASGTGNGTLMVWIDPPFVSGTHTPVPGTVPAINIPYNIRNAQNSQGIALTGGKAWVGFTASQTSDPQAHDILAWEFTPHAVAHVQQVIPPGGTPAIYNFGANDTAVTYFPGFVNNGCDGTTPSDPCLMTVVATPWQRSVFHNTRLAPGPFDHEQCIVYQGTGGNCIVYSITCQQFTNPTVNVACPASLPNTCNNIGDPGCIVFSTSFYTLDNVTPTNADYLKTDPIGSNNWISIFEMYEPNVFDGRTTGTGGTPSDFVGTFKPNVP